MVQLVTSLVSPVRERVTLLPPLLHVCLKSGQETPSLTGLLHMSSREGRSVAALATMSARWPCRL